MQLLVLLRSLYITYAMSRHLITLANFINVIIQTRFCQAVFVSLYIYTHTRTHTYINIYTAITKKVVPSKYTAFYIQHNLCCSQSNVHRASR